MATSEFVNYVVDLLAPYGYIRVRPMFGGHSVYRDGVIVAIIVGRNCILKLMNNLFATTKIGDQSLLLIKLGIR
ncbi:MAG: hypothetical protein EBQ62_02865 [Alphaproteobacteria bacterium]|nr:hypothetical protein [Alphaproteobacteria bacterium]